MSEGRSGDREAAGADGDAPRRDRDGDAARRDPEADGDAPRRDPEADGDAPRRDCEADGDAPRREADGDAPRRDREADGDAARRDPEAAPADAARGPADAASIGRFFAAAAPLLFGEESPADFSAAAGPSPSGLGRLGFYAILVERNLAKILRDFYGGLAAWMERGRPGLWAALLCDYARAHPPEGWDPNRYAAAFPGFLAARRAEEPRLLEVDEELADFYWIEYAAFSAADAIPRERAPDGVDHRIFVRQYTRAIPAFARALRRGESPALPAAAPTLTIVFRNPTLRVESMHPSIAAIAALVRRQGGDPAALVPGIEAAAIDEAEAELRRRGVLVDGPEVAG